MVFKYGLYIYQAALRFYKSVFAHKKVLANAINDLINYYSKEKMMHTNMDVAYIKCDDKLKFINKLLDECVQLKFVHEVRERSVRGGGWPQIVSMKIPAPMAREILREHKEILPKLKQYQESEKLF